MRSAAGPASSPDTHSSFTRGHGWLVHKEVRNTLLATFAAFAAWSVAVFTAVAYWTRGGTGWNPAFFTAALAVMFFAIAGALILASFVAKRLELQNNAILHMALHDSLTQLGNRTQLYQHLHGLIGAHTPCALLVLDLNRFKEVNDTLGHDIGDEILKAAAARIQSAVRNTDNAARLDGDEFALVLGGAGLEQATNTARRITRALGTPFQCGGMSVSVTASTGIALYPDHGTNPNALIQHAEAAMYWTKTRNTGYTVYTPKLFPHNIRRLSLMGALREAMEYRQLLLYFQPKIDLSAKRAIGVEALLRWQHPTMGFVPPAEFIPLAEQSDMIRLLTHWVLDETLQHYRLLRRMGIELEMAVNLSSRNLHDTSLPLRLAALLAQHDVPPERLTLELTETAIMADPAFAMKILQRLDHMGVRLSIDDFGTGYSSLLYLKQLPFSQIKIDRSFVMNMTQNEDDEVIVRSTIDLAHNMKCHVVAEGVEDEQTLAQLGLLGCDMAQGYLIARPMPAHELASWLNTTPWHRGNGIMAVSA